MALFPSPLIREIAWTPDITTRLDHEAARSCLAWLQREVAEGVSQLWECSHGSDVLHVVTRLDANPTEWVWCYAHGTGIKHFAPHFLDVAARKRWPVRFHTVSPAIVRMARRYGFGVKYPTEFVMRR